MSASKPIAGKYLPLRPLAAGGMAEVELARQVGIDGFEKLVVLKRIRPEFANDLDFVARFLDEARTVADLRHPNIVQIYDAGHDETGFWLAMAFVHGLAVRKLWRDAEAKKQRVPIEHVVHVVVGAARGLHYAHEKTHLDGRPLGIVHRDVSPQNLLVSFQGEVKVADFGIARTDDQQHRTRAGHVWGKLDYMAPEQARGGVVTAASDQFALGIITWELATGERLFRRDTDAETLAAVLACRVPSIASKVPGFPPPLERVIEKALAPESRDRHASCAVFASELEAAAARVPLVLSDGRLGAYLRDAYPEESKELTLSRLRPRSGETAAPPPVAPPDRSRARFLYGGGAMLALAATGVFAWSRRVPARLGEAEALFAAKDFDAALDAALEVLDGDPTNERAREIARASADDVVERRSFIDARASDVWMREIVARHPGAADLLRKHRLIIEVRVLVLETYSKLTDVAVVDFVRKNSGTPEVGLAAARSMRRRGMTETSYLWMYADGLHAGLPASPEMFEAATSVLAQDAFPESHHAQTAHFVAGRADERAFRDWVTSQLLHGSGLALLNAMMVGTPSLNMYGFEHLEALKTLMTNRDATGDAPLIAFFEALDAASPAEQKRVIDTVRSVAKHDELPVVIRERLVRVNAILDGKEPRPRE